MAKVQQGSCHNLMFRALVDAMTKFPLSSALAGSELVHMALQDGVLLAHGGALVRSKAQVKGKGAFDWISVDSRLLGPFAALVQSEVSFEVDEAGKLIKLTSGRQELSIPYASGSPYTKAVGTRTVMTADLTDEDAKRINYLADVASEDESRPDLNCVAVAQIDGHVAGIAANQRATAVVQLASFTETGFVPLAMARVLTKGDKLARIGTADAAQLGSSVGLHVAPLIERNKDFPVPAVGAFIALPRTKVGTVAGADFVQAFANCKDCLGLISKVGAFVVLSFSPDGLEMHAQNGGGARFRTEIAATAKKPMKIYLPLDEVVNASRLFDDLDMEISLGKVNGEVFMTAPGTTVVVAPWKKE